MAIASMILGIVSTIFSLIPGFGYLMIVPAIVGLVLGIVAVVKSKTTGKGKESAVAGIVLSSISLAILVAYTAILIYFVDTAFDFVSENGKDLLNEIKEEIENVIQKVELGETFKSENLEVSILSLNHDYKDYESVYQIEDGYKVLALEVKVKNTSNQTQHLTLYDFKCTADLNECDKFFGAMGYNLSMTILPRETITQDLAFIVPEYANTIQVFANIDNKMMVLNVQ